MARQADDLVDPRSPIPLPRQLKEILIAKIHAGQFVPGKRIPSERELGEKYGLSRITARQTLTEMISENYLFRIPGKGTFVELAGQLARKLQRGSLSVGFLVNSNWYSSVQPGYTRMLEGVERALGKRGYKVFFRTMDDRARLATLDPTRTDGDALDGLILVGPVRGDLIDRVQESRIPFTLLDAPEAPAGVNAVCMNYFEGSIDAVRYLLKLGHREIGYVGPKDSGKYSGYLKALEDAQVAANPAHSEFLAIEDAQRAGFSHGREAVMKLEARKSMPTALYLVNDVVALGAMDGLKSGGLRVPNDVSMVGCGDLDLYGQADPPLTTICTDLEEFGAAGVDRLFSLMETPDQPSRFTHVPLQLVIRGSTAPRVQAAEKGRIKGKKPPR